MVSRMTCRIEEIGTVVGGATPSTKNKAYWDGSIPWLTPKDLVGCQGRYIKAGEKRITEAGYSACSTCLLPKGTVLFSSRAPIGYIAISDGEVCTNQGFKSIIPNEDIDSLYLYYLLQFYRNQIANIGSGTTFPEVSGKAMRQFEVTIAADKEERKTIACILGAIDDKIELNNRINDYLAAWGHLGNIDLAGHEFWKQTVAKPGKPLVLLGIRQHHGMQSAGNGLKDIQPASSRHSDGFSF